MKINQLVSKRTRFLMKERKWTQYQLAQKSALPLSTLSHILACKSKTLTLETLLNICRGFEMNLSDFFDPSFALANISDDD